MKISATLLAVTGFGVALLALLAVNALSPLVRFLAERGQVGMKGGFQ